jgi:F1F0 ATPase subunit 2
MRPCTTDRTTLVSETLLLMTALIAGLVLGAIFYGGLWWTVRRSVSSRTLSLWLTGSFALRAIIAVSGFYFVSQGDWRRLLGCLLGFVVARIGVTQLTKIRSQQKDRRVQGVGR